MFVVKPFWKIIFQCIRKVNKYTILGTKYGNQFLVLHIKSGKMDKKCEIGLYHVKLDRVTYNRNFFAKKVKNTQTYRTALLKNSFNWHVTPNLFLSPAWKKFILCSLWFFALLCKKWQSCKIYHRIISKWIIEKCPSQGGQNEAHKNRTFN